MFVFSGAEVTQTGESCVSELGLENEKRAWWTFVILWVVSFLALITNGSQLIFKKIIHPRTPIKVLWWKMGRDKNHVSSFFFDRFCPILKEVKVGAASWAALELFYNWHEVRKDLKGLELFIADFWMEILNRKSVYNRLVMAINELSESFQSSFERYGEARVMSVASGSAQAVILTMKKHPWIPVKATVIDLDPTAIEYVKRQAMKAGCYDKFRFVVGSTDCIEEEARRLKPTIVEVFGFLDYRGKQSAVKLFDRIMAVLPSGGRFLTCNINKNIEKIFLDFLLIWPMIYRTKEQLADLTNGLTARVLKCYYEHYKIHAILVCEKP